MKPCPFVVGITGGSGAGKTFVIDELKKIFGDKIVVISQDNYYKVLERLKKERWDRAIYDEPEAFDNKEMASDIKKLINGESVSLPVYDFKTHSRLKEEIKVDPATVVIIEGIFTFNVKELRDLMDYKVFLHSDGDVRLSRRLLRDIKERGQSVETIAKAIEWYLEVVKPRQEHYIIPMQKYADLVINTNDGSREAVKILEVKIRDYLETGKFDF
ncbi:MAG: uridine kinase [Candidatus Berkelbacteria bacterium]|nr:uridine kinase [Candidatus Berkelbacteria bacterium]